MILLFGRFLWQETNETTEDIGNLSYGAYTLIITDANGCTTEIMAYVEPYIGKKKKE
jgi:hypothetical protein